ncbi:semaphorin-6C-like, partial [Notothenia coriiceps]|uniref:Semaphorin-6C-like n=1 Tax=Notothenia coriiceps TaxID=8208 RepID=A0A6I9N1K9_9TELE
HLCSDLCRDHVFAVNLTTASEEFFPQLKLTWRSEDVSKCTVRGKNSDECYTTTSKCWCREMTKRCSPAVPTPSTPPAGTTR